MKIGLRSRICGAIIGIAMLLLTPLYSHAQMFPTVPTVPVYVAADFPFGQKEYFLDMLVKGAARMIARAFVNASIEWLRSGGQGGAPLFITDFSDFAKDVAVNASGMFIEQLQLSDMLCGPFPLAFDINFYGSAGLPKYEEFDCTIEDVVANMEDWENDFRNGGWMAWDEIMKPQNRPESAYLLAVDASFEIGGEEEDEASVKAGAQGGLLTVRTCENVDIPLSNGQTATETKCKDTSPQAAVGEALHTSLGTSMNWLIDADEISELVMALGDFALTKLFSDDSGILGTDRDTPRDLEGDSGTAVTLESSQRELKTSVNDMTGTVDRTASILRAYINEQLALQQDPPYNPLLCSPSNPSCLYTVDNGGCALSPPIRGCPVLISYGGTMVDAEGLFADLQAQSNALRAFQTFTIDSAESMRELTAIAENLRSAWNSAVQRIRIAESIMTEGQVSDFEGRIARIAEGLDDFIYYSSR